MGFRKAAEKKVQPVIDVPSLYGSHSSMIESEADGSVTLRDEKGLYETTRDRLDSGLADPRRYNSSRVVEDPTLKAKVVK